MLGVVVQVLLHLFVQNTTTFKLAGEAPATNGITSEPTNHRVRDAEEFELEGLITDDDAESDGEDKGR